MSIHKPRAVVFDIGNVLLNWDPDQLYAKLFPDVDARAAFFEEVDIHSVNLAIDAGAPFRDSIYQHAEKFPKYRDQICAWHDRWGEMASPLIDDSCAILRQLRAQNFPVFALSNFGTDSFAYAETVYPILKEFDQRYISGPLGVIKPNPEIYQIVEDGSGLSGPDLFFIDDSLANIKAAAARGWQVEHFTPESNLRQRLVDLKVTV